MVGEAGSSIVTLPQARFVARSMINLRNCNFFSMEEPEETHGAAAHNIYTLQCLCSVLANSVIDAMILRG